jgi:transaldolase
MNNNPLLKIQESGQSIWMDFISRQTITSGELKKLIKADGLRGVTSNPAIFDKVIEGSADYDDDVRTMARQDKRAEDIYQALTIKDVQQAADQFRPLYDGSGGRHGFVSLEVNPHLARDIEGTLKEARRLWSLLDRPNVLIKVPGTAEGLTCIKQLISEGININVTLLFGLPRYRQVADAYLAGLKERAKKEQPLERVASVASFFLSRIDVLVDSMLEKLIKAGGSKAAAAENLRGQVAIASARQAFQIYKQIFSGGNFRELSDRGARPQRVLWASTSTKNPEYSDVKYVEALIGPETINTLPKETLDAYRDHGDPAPRLEKDLQQAEEVFHKLAEVDIDIDAATQQLEDEGIEKFNQPYDSLLETLEKKRRNMKK